MLKKIIKTHTARLDFVDTIKPTFFYETLSPRTAKDGWPLVLQKLQIYHVYFLFGVTSGVDSYSYHFWTINK